MKKYSDCYFCGGIVEEQFLPREIRWHDQLLVFENVPMGVCVQCGQKVLLPETAKRIDLAIQAKQKPSRILQVPVYQFQADVV